jgi:surfactin synthase thioesterase subunit
MRRSTLVCFPFAGAGPLFFRPWSQFADLDLEIFAPPLPGRERLVDRSPPGSIQEVAEAVLPSVEERAAAGPVVLFGHCFGATLAYEVARHLDGMPVLHLFASGAAGPWTCRQPRATGLPDEQFIELVEEMAGYRHPALAHPEMRSLIMPALRADLEITENYRPTSMDRFDVPITAIRGKDDRFVSKAEIEDWARVTNRGFDSVEVSGDHMYIVHSGRLIVDMVRAVVRS